MATAELDWFGPSGSAGDNNSITAKYYIDDAANVADAIGAMLAQAPPALGNLVITGASADPETDTLFLGTITYGTRDLKESSYQFEIGVSSTKITQSLETVGSYARPGKTPSNFKGAIGVTKEGVEGTEISVPEFSWNETHYLSRNQVDRSYFFLLFNQVARMNAATFREFDIGEVLLLGVNGSLSRSIPMWEMQFKFVASPNASNLGVGDITISEKLGHDYLWVRYTEELDSSAKAMVKIPFEVFVERVYEFGDMDALSLPDPF